MHDKHKGSRAELLACAWLLKQGYEVFRTDTGHCGFDLEGLVATRGYRLNAPAPPRRLSLHSGGMRSEARRQGVLRKALRPVAPEDHGWAVTRPAT